MRLPTCLASALLLAVPSDALPAELLPAHGYLNSTTAADCVVTFNEVMYHPAGDGAPPEWIELQNQMAVDVDLSDWLLDGGVAYRFPRGTVIRAGANLLVAGDPVALEAATGLANVLGPFTGALANEGERLILRNLNGRLLDELTYSDQPPWPVGADGSGASLAKRLPASPSSPPENWRASREIGGTPGRANFPEMALPEQPAVDVLLGPTARGRWFVPDATHAAVAWTAPAFADGAWPQGTNGFGFDRSNTPPMTRPVRFYPLESDLQDASGNALHGQAQGGPVFAVDRPPLLAGSLTSLRFDGRDDTVTMPEPVVPEAYALALWVKLATVRACSLLVLTSGEGPNTHWSHQLRLNSTGQFEHYTFDGGQNLVTGRTVAQPGRWYHVAATAQNGGSIRLFVDGVEEGTAGPIGSVWAGGDRWMLGSTSGHTPNLLDGWLDEVAIWHEAIPADQVATLAAGGSSFDAGGLRGLFVTDLAAPLWTRNSSVWLRLPFTRAAGVYHDQLLLRARYNDGFVAWLNGVEVVRRNAPAALAWDSAATDERTPGQSAVPEVIDLSAYAGLVRPGANLLAVQGLNRAPDNHNFLLQLELNARRGVPAAEATGLVFSELPAAGTAPFWCELVNAGSSPVALADHRLRDAQGRDFPLGNRALEPGELELVMPPTPVPALRNGDRLFLFSADGSQLRDAARITPDAQARASIGADHPFLRPAQLSPGTANTFRSRDEIVINEVFHHAPPTYRQPGTPPQTSTRTIVRWDARWRYDQSGANLGTAWRQPAYDDSGWASGPGLLGHRTGALAEPLRTPLTLGRWTYYFRVPFVVEPPADPTTFQLRVLVDDGAVFYLNGVEVYRQKMPEGAINFTTPAINVGDPLITGPHTLEVTKLLPGTNWLAAEVHQWHLDSSDIVLGAELAVAEAVTPGTPGTPFVENDEQWIELLNRSDHAVDLGGWRLADAIDFTFPPETVLGPGELLVVARDAAALRSRHPDVRVLGDFSRRLSHRSDPIVLRDGAGNPADTVRYQDDAPWPAAADGGGSSLELRDPRADNSSPSAWAASDETPRASWQRYLFRARAVEPVFGPPLQGFSELRLGLLDDGEFLLDNVAVIEDPDGARRSLLGNGDFATDASGWRLLGNHSHSRVELDPDRPDNRVLRVVATDPRGYLHNQIENTLQSGGSVVPVVAGREYEIAFDARWLRGSPQLHVELYYNRIARTLILGQPAIAGTPGQPNSTAIANLGPTYTSLTHDPPVPKPGQAIEVRVTAQDPDGLDSLTLHYAIQEGAWQQMPMARQVSGPEVPADAPTTFTASLPPQTASGTVIQFYVVGHDPRGAASFWPAAGPDSRALIRVDSRTPGPRRPSFHLILTARDGRWLDEFQNMMSDDRLGATVVWDNREVFYDCGVHLHGSMFSRNNPDSASYNVRFPADHLFRGVHRTVQLKRRVLQEILAKHAQNQAGVPGMYDDIVHLFSHRPGNAGAARMSLAHYNDIYLDSQYASGAEGTLFNMEGIRVAMATHDGSPSGFKLPFPIDWVSNYDITDLGDDPEQYRWSTMIRNNRARDDYTPYIALAKTFSLTGTALQRAVPDVMDIDEWMRVFALLSLFGIGDTYTQGNPHNLNFYVRPADQRILALPYDWDFLFALDPSAPLWGNQNLARIISLPVYTRLFHGHLLDLMETTFHTDYLTPWVTHYGAVAGEDYRSILDRVRARSQYVRSRLPAAVPFAITSNDGADFTVTNLVVPLEGRAWIDVRDIRLTGQPAPLPLTWLDATRWRVAIPLAPGENPLTLEARNRRGENVGQDAITVRSTGVDDAQRRFLRLTEIMYHPAPPTGPERDAGFTDADQFEFLEFANLGPEPVDLDGVHLDRGVTFDFTGSAFRSLAPGGRVLITRDAAAARFRYGQHLPIAGNFTGGLDNGGETLRLLDRHGFVIQEFTYDDEGDWPRAADGQGHSLEALDPHGNPADPAHWQASARPGGSPGQPEYTPPFLASVTIRDDHLVLRFAARPGQPYRLLAAPDPVNGPWEEAAALAPSPVAQTNEISDPLPPGADRRFYRVVSP
jgi:hypothetical protein